MNGQRSHLSRLGFALFAILAMPLLASAQNADKQAASGRQAKVANTGFVEDWSTRHLVYSNPGSEARAIQEGRHAEWVRIVNDPRYTFQKRKVMAAGRPVDAGAGNAADHSADAGSGRVAPSSQAHEASSLNTDWSEGLNTGSPSPISDPAKFSFSTTSASCANDFVIYSTGSAGTSTQASLIAFSNIYSGCTGTVPMVAWAYNTGAAIPGAPVFSADGKQLAFIQVASSVASVAILKLPASSTFGTGGSVGAPIAPTPESNSTYSGCSAPCMTTITLDGSPNVSWSDPWVDYEADALYVGDDSGNLHKISPLFSGTPAETIGGIPSWPVLLDSNVKLASPVVDPVSGYLFVGDQNGFFYSIGTADPGTHTTSGRRHGTSAQLGTNGTEIFDAPIVDPNAAEAYVFVQEDGTGNNGVFQFSTNFTNGSSGTEETVGTFGRSLEYFFAGTFDNLYLTSEGNDCPPTCTTPTGNLYVVGNTKGPATLYQIPIASNVMSAANKGPALGDSLYEGRSSGITEFFNPSVTTSASGSITLISDPAGWAANTQVTVGSVTYTFVTVLTAVNQVLEYTDGFGHTKATTDEDDTALNLVAVINGAPGACPSTSPVCVFPGQTANAAATASAASHSNKVELAATVSGSAGDFTVSTNESSEISVNSIAASTGVDYIFLSVYSGGGGPAGSTCPTGCVMNFDVTSGATLTTSAVPLATLPEEASTSDMYDGFVTGGISIDNSVPSTTLAGASEIYFLTLDNSISVPCSVGTGICAIQASQTTLSSSQ